MDFMLVFYQDDQWTPDDALMSEMGQSAGGWRTGAGPVRRVAGAGSRLGRTSSVAERGAIDPGQPTAPSFAQVEGFAPVANHRPPTGEGHDLAGQGVPQRLPVELEILDPLLQPAILLLDLPQTPGLGDVPATVLPAPAVERLPGDPVLAARLPDARAPIDALEVPDDLLFARSATSHC